MIKTNPKPNSWGNIRVGQPRMIGAPTINVDELIRESRTFTQVEFSSWAKDARLTRIFHQAEGEVLADEKTA
jgi:hypothetical protein